MSQQGREQFQGERHAPVAAPHPPAQSPRYRRADFPELECLRNSLPAETLALAAARAKTLGTGADRVLLAYGFVDEASYLTRLSVRFGIRQIDTAELAVAEICPDAVAGAAQTGLLQLTLRGHRLLVMTLRGFRARNLVMMAIEQPREIGRVRLVTERALQDMLLYRTRGIIGPAISGLQDRFPALSAAPAQSPLRRAVRHAMFWLGLLAIVSIGYAFAAEASHLLALIFLAAIGLRLTASLIGKKNSAPKRLADFELPEYSVIAALYHEANSVPQLLSALSSFDYPREKLDIILVVESDDLATRAAIARCRPPSCVRVVVAPDEGPRTKPKALNAALPFARGKYVAVFDAEDLPDPNQLRIALDAFRHGGDDLVCVQARLAIHNAEQSFFTRMFAAEYAGQFDIMMPGYDRLGLPWPLGGTSNHFDADKLREVGAWDPFNVTEDADLGLRFARFRFRTATIDSTTWEEAPVSFMPWLKQRTRWMKGWMQTWAVHGRQPRRYWRQTGWRGWVARDLIIGGALLAALAYPLSLVVAAWLFGELLLNGETSWTGGVLSPLHLASFFGGLAVTIIIQMRGLAYRGRWRDAWVLLATPIYWGCLSAAAWRALFQLRNDPYRWEKTEHGSQLDPSDADEAEIFSA